MPASTILVVDDDPAILALADAILRSVGYHVLLAEGGWRAVQVYESATQSINLLLTDVFMPDLTGPVLAARFRAKNPYLRVLFISGFHDTEFVQLSMRNGFALLTKPFDTDGLLRAVRHSLA